MPGHICGASIKLLQESMFVDFCITVNSYTIKLKHKSTPSVRACIALLRVWTHIVVARKVCLGLWILLHWLFVQDAMATS